MRKESRDFLENLISIPSPSGFEERIQEVCRQYVEPFVNNVYKDVHGNQYAVKNPEAALRVMLAGHVDEVGLMVNYIDDEGFLSVLAIGGVDPAVVTAQHVHVHTAKGPIPGAISCTGIHLIEKEDRGKPLKMHELWVDIGAKDKQDAEKLVAVGDPITINSGFVQLHDDIAVARGFDDRIGAFVIIEAMRLLARCKIGCAIYCVTTVQEEVGLRGACTSTYGCDPHAGIAVDVDDTMDYPGADRRKYGSSKIHGGPIIARGPNINPIVGRGLIEAAKKHKIPYQIGAVSRGTPTDANAIQLSRSGVATGLVSVPNRYTHSPVELISLRDAENTAKLIAEWITTLKPGMSFIP